MRTERENLIAAIKDNLESIRAAVTRKRQESGVECKDDIQYLADSLILASDAIDYLEIHRIDTPDAFLAFADKFCTMPVVSEVVAPFLPKLDISVNMVLAKKINDELISFMQCMHQRFDGESNPTVDMRLAYMDELNAYSQGVASATKYLADHPIVQISDLYGFIYSHGLSPAVQGSIKSTFNI